MLKHGLLQLALRTMNFLHRAFYAFRITFIRQQSFGQFSIRSTNRRDQFIPAPSEFSFNRLQIAFLLGVKTQLAMNPVMIINRPCDGLVQEVIADIKCDRSDGAEQQYKKQEANPDLHGCW